MTLSGSSLIGYSAIIGHECIVKSVLRSCNITHRALRKRLEKLEALLERLNRKVETAAADGVGEATRLESGALAKSRAVLQVNCLEYVKPL